MKHETVRHSVGALVRDLAHTNGIESFWALLKRGYTMARTITLVLNIFIAISVNS